MSSLTDLYISDSYTGLLHAGGIPLPVSGQVTMFDGSGNVSALSLGVAGEGATIDGVLTVGSLQYPTSPLSIGSVVVQISDTSLGLVSELPGSILSSIIEAGTYSNIKSITVTDSGLVDAISEYDDSDGVTVSYTTYITPNDLGDVSFTGENVGDDWTTITLPDIFVGAKAGIFFLSPTAVTNIGANNSKITYYVTTDDKSKIYPIHATFEVNADGESTTGFQFQCPVKSRKLYFSRSTEGSVGTGSFKLFGLAKQG